MLIRNKESISDLFEEIDKNDELKLLKEHIIEDELKKVANMNAQSTTNDLYCQIETSTLLDKPIEAMKRVIMNQYSDDESSHSDNSNEDPTPTQSINS
jgi:hypothetical protein